MARKVIKISKGITFHPAGDKARRVALSFSAHEKVNRALNDEARKHIIIKNKKVSPNNWAIHPRERNV